MIFYTEFNYAGEVRQINPKSSSFSLRGIKLGVSRAADYLLLN